MKKRFILGLSFSSILTVSLLAVSISVKNENTKKAEGYSAASLPTTIDLNDTSAANIRSYYSSLNNLSQSERQGTNLLKNLKTILKNGQKYFSYENGTSIWQMYEITDRDWDKSPASSTTYGTYNANTNKITGYTYGTSASNSKNNPYIHALYINRDVNNQTTAWDNHNQDQWGINREHVWPKAEGFDTAGAGGARGDPMHLMAGNGYSNNIHSNYYYGYVKTSSSYTDCGNKYSNQTGNLRGTSKTLNTGTVFEPQDCDKGDIARAIFYMVARYNYLSGSDSDGIDTNNPNLTLTQNIGDWSSGGYTSSTTKQGKLGVLTDLLAWHHADPVDQYEIHRNNLLYTNFTNNRNPFIDFPEWVDYIWGTATYNGTTYQSYSSTPTGYAKPATDAINSYNASNPEVNSVTVSPSSLSLVLNGGAKTGQLTVTVDVKNDAPTTVNWTSSNTSIATVSSSGLVTAKAVGSATITATSTYDNTKIDTCEVSVSQGTISVTGVTISSEAETMAPDASLPLSATVEPEGATNKNVTWSSSDTDVATVSGSGLVVAKAEGTATITVTTEDGGYTAQCEITVSTPAPVSSSTYSLYSGTITAGDYIVYYDGKAMKSTVSSNKLSYEEVTPTNGNIIDPDNSIVWTISPSDNYWTLYSSSANKFAASTGTKNQARLLEDGTDDKSLWTVTGNSTYEFANKYNYAQNVNYTLRENTTYGFACYSTSTGGALSLYKKTASSTAVDGVTLNHNAYNLKLGDSYSLVATVSPAGATNTDVEWESSDPSVVEVESDGTITGITTGTATITVTTDDGGFTAQCVVTVTSGYTLTSGSPYINGVPYKMFFVNPSGEDPVTNYFTGTMAGYYGATSNQISKAVDVYFEASGDGQNIYFIDGDDNPNYFSVLVSGTHYNFAYSTDEPTTKWKYEVSGSDYSCMTFRLDVEQVSTPFTFGNYGTYSNFSTVNLSKNKNNYEVEFVASDEIGALGLASVMNQLLTCDSTGATAPTFTSGYSWTAFEKAYNELNDNNKTTLREYEADEEGLEIAKMVARYDYIVGKYGSSAYTDFIQRNPSPIGNSALTDVVTELNSSNLTIIVTCGVIGGLLALGVYVLIRKKKED